MSLRRQLGVLFVVAGFSQCTPSDPVAPLGAVMGRWGGLSAELVADQQLVRVKLDCDLLEFDAPILPGPDGSFVLPVMGRSKSLRPPPPTVLRGRLIGTTLQIDLLYVRADTTRGQTFTLLRDSKPQFHSFCTT